MLAVQVAAASLLFPVLLQNWRSMAIAVVTAWPFAELAGFLADAQRNQWVAGEVYVSVWLVTLYLWAGILRNSWVRLFGVALAAILSLGGPVLLYLRSEFSEGGEMATGRFAYFGPIAGAVSLTFPDWSFRVWVMPMIFFLSGVIAFAMHCARYRDKLST